MVIDKACNFPLLINIGTVVELVKDFSQGMGIKVARN
jgi:hypothetical protein